MELELNYFKDQILKLEKSANEKDSMLKASINQVADKDELLRKLTEEKKHQEDEKNDLEARLDQASRDMEALRESDRVLLLRLQE